jgi:hypothetical protein
VFAGAFSILTYTRMLAGVCSLVCLVVLLLQSALDLPDNYSRSQLFPFIDVNDGAFSLLLPHCWLPYSSMFFQVYAYLYTSTRLHFPLPVAPDGCTYSLYEIGL